MSSPASKVSPLDSIKRLIDVVEKRLSESPAVVDKDSILRMIEEVGDQCLSIIPKIERYRSYDSSSVARFLVEFTVKTPPPTPLETVKGHCLNVDTNIPVVSADALYIAYTKFLTRNGVPPCSKQAFGRQMSLIGVAKERIRGDVHYVGIRLRLSGDPPPRFPEECTPPYRLVEEGQAFVRVRLRYVRVPPDVSASIGAWIEKRYEFSGTVSDVVETKDAYSKYVADTNADIPLEQFEYALPIVFDSFPSDIRWSMDPITGELPGQMEQLKNRMKRRWVPLLERNTENKSTQ